MFMLYNWLDNLASCMSLLQHLFEPEGLILTNIGVIQREGKRYQIPLSFLPV
mgnify:CR=1 FL=1